MDNGKSKQKSSHIAAIAFRDDMEFFRQVIADPELQLRHLRQASVSLRRLLIEGDLKYVANPRLGALRIMAIDPLRIVKANIGFQPKVIIADCASIYGLEFGPLGYHLLSDERTDISEHVEWPIDKFLNRPVLCVDGRWFERQSILKFVANTQGGAHSKSGARQGSRTAETERLLANAMKRYRLQLKDKTLTIDIWSSEFGLPAAPSGYRPTMIDAVSFCVAATASWLLKSPIVQNLEKLVNEELS